VRDESWLRLSRFPYVCWRVRASVSSFMSVVADSIVCMHIVSAAAVVVTAPLRSSFGRREREENAEKWAGVYANIDN
jgi:hypothetical protein